MGKIVNLTGDRRHVVRAKITRWVSEAATECRERILNLTDKDNPAKDEIVALLDDCMKGCTIEIHIKPDNLQPGQQFVRLLHRVKED